MAEVRNKKVILKDYVNGFPKESDMLLDASSIISLSLSEASNGILVKNLYLSCDPYMRGRMSKSQGSYVDSFTPGSIRTRTPTNGGEKESRWLVVVGGGRPQVVAVVWCDREKRRGEDNRSAVANGGEQMVGGRRWCTTEVVVVAPAVHEGGFSDLKEEDGVGGSVGGGSGGVDGGSGGGGDCAMVVRWWRQVVVVVDVEDEVGVCGCCSFQFGEDDGF
ncbi:hypothetical protein OSB04_un001842 [Centaurea solstitialis]|uniref:Oxidoreductase N-terminal domain-containing protein n=1 Tax=Centaurea solstitialis TaxID=347529 RepID=A0AA38SA41_9ASTR|nr:hypothetical protein OSB04_un001842 [Centaurea solstitialis]